MPTPIPAIGTISDPTKVRVALMQGNQAVNGPPLSVVAAAVGVPSGGTTGQVLTKSTDADYDSGWADIPTQGDLSGPASAVDGNFAAFDGTTGKLVKDSGKKASDFQTALGYTPANVAGDTFTGAVRFNGAVGVGRTPSAIGGIYFNRNPDNPFLLFSAGDPAVSTTDIGQFRASLASNIIGITGPTGAPYYVSVNTSTGAVEVNADPTTAKGIVTKQYADALPLAKSYESAQQTITAAGSLTLAHGLGGQPKLYQAFLKCVTAELGYSAGDEIIVDPHTNNNSATSNRGLSIVPGVTNLNVRFGSDATVFSILRKDTGAAANITLANWKFIVRAWL